MRLMHEVVINRSRTQIWQLLTDPGSLPQWQPTLSRMELIGGH